MIRRTFNLLVAACALTGAAGVRAAGFDVEGKFQRVVPNQPTETPQGIIEVVDIFGYRCPHCFSFLPVLERFENEVPDDVQVRHMPVIFRDSWEAPARAFYTAKLLGVLDRVHRPIFEALHVVRDGRLSQPDLLGNLLDVEDLVPEQLQDRQGRRPELGFWWLSLVSPCLRCRPRKCTSSSMKTAF